MRKVISNKINTYLALSKVRRYVRMFPHMLERKIDLDNIDHMSEGSGGLGRLYVDAYKTGKIDMLSQNVSDPSTAGERVLAQQKWWSAVISEGASEIAWERSRNGGNDDFENPASNRPPIEDITRLLMHHQPMMSGPQQAKYMETIGRIREAFQKPVQNAALGHSGMTNSGMAESNPEQ
jgi:hypothetical protein